MRPYVLLTVVGALVLSGCSSTQPGSQAPAEVVLETTRAEPASTAVCDPRTVEGTSRSSQVCVDRAGEDLLVTTWGSSSCARVPTSVSATSATEVALVMGSLTGPDGSCTADDQATTARVALPDGADRSGPLTVRVSGASLDATLGLPAG